MSNGACKGFTTFTCAFLLGAFDLTEGARKSGPAGESKGGKGMPDLYERLYFKVAATVADTVEALHEITEILKNAQI